MSGSASLSYSLHPSLRRVHLASVAQDGGGGGGGGTFSADLMDTPYPTLAQHEKTEQRYEKAVGEYETALAEYRTSMSSRPVHLREPEPMPPVRQPPTMLAAMQRPDLTGDARKGVLRKLAPRISTMDKKYKFILNSDARRNPLHSTSADYTVDVGTDIFPTKVNGFEIIGYSFPQTEWTIEPYENSMPFRYGWCPCPGRRLYGLHTKTFDFRIPMAEPPDRYLAPRQPFPFAFTGQAHIISCELPLVRNPIVRIQVVPATMTLPKRVRLTFARRVGSEIGVLAAAVGGGNISSNSSTSTNPSSSTAPLPILVLDDVGIQHSTGQYPGRFVLRKDGFVQPPQLHYIERSTQEGNLPAELPLSLRELYDPSVHGQGTDPHYTLSITDPEFTRHFVDGTEARTTAATNYNSLGSLYCRPAARASEFAFRLSLMLVRLLERRQAWEESTGSQIHVPLRRAVVEWDQNVNKRFVLRAGWSFAKLERVGYASMGDIGKRAVETGMDSDTVHRLVMPISALSSDRLGVHFGLPMELGAMAVPDSFFSTSIQASSSPRIRAETTVDVEPMADPSALEGYFKSLNTAATSLRFQPAELAPLTSPLFFTVPIALDGTVHLVSLTSGEYRPWQLSHALTEAIQSNPNLRPLRIVVTPIFLQHTGNSLAGFRFESLSGMTFDLALEDGNPNIVSPTKLGYRRLRYGGQSIYDPVLLGVMDDPYAGLSVPITFPSADLGQGDEIFSPMPTTPFLLPVFNNKRLQISHNALPSDHINLSRVNGTELSHSASASLTLPLERTMLFHHHQPVRLQLTVRADLLILDATAGTGEAAEPSPPFTLSTDTTSGMYYSSTTTSTTSLLPAPTFEQLEAAYTSFTFSDILTTIALINDPLNGAAGFMLDSMVRLIGRVGVSYSGFVPSGIMTQDGPYRIIHSSISPEHLNALGIPSGTQIDALLTSLCANIQTRNVFSALASTIVRIIKSSALSGVPIHLLSSSHPLYSLTTTNGSIALGTLAVVIASFAVLSRATSTSSSLSTAFSRPFLLELVNVALWKSVSSSPLITSDPASVPSLIRQGVTYLVESPSALSFTGSASVRTDRIVSWQVGEGLWAFSLLPEVCISVGAGPYTIDINPLGYANVPIQNLEEPGTSETYANILSGRTYTLNYAAGLTPFSPPISPQQVINVVVNTADRSITFTARHNVVGGAVTVSFNNNAVITTLNLTDSTEALLAKMILVANNYSVSVPGFAEIDLRGTNANPFPSGDVRFYMTELLGAQDPGLLSNRFLQFKPTTSATFAPPPASLLPTLSPTQLAVDIRAVFREMIGVVALTSLLSGEPEDSIPATAVVSRINEHPFSVDFSTQTSQRIRPDRLGMVDGYEYTADMRRVPIGGDLLALHLASIGSAVDLDRSGPPYLLLNIEINGDPTPYSTSLRPDGIQISSPASSAFTSSSTSFTPPLYDGVTRLQNHSNRGEVISLGSQQNRTIIRSTAYVELGSDQTTLRLLDRQDDRAPVLFPTSIVVNWVRILVTRPDGTPYNFHGRRTMVGLRFMSHPDNPDFVAAIAKKEEEQAHA